jgi:hypothetical protein
MKTLIAGATLVLFTGGQAVAQNTFTPDMVRAAKEDPKQYTIDESSVEFYRVGPSIGPKTKLPPATTPPPKDPLVVLDRILNLATKIWKIIEANKPVVDVKTTYANALPQGITHWSQMGGWRPPVGTIYGFRANNGYGVKVIDVRYQVIRHVGGSYKGKGQYLNGVAIEPLRVDASWGYTFKMGAEATSVANVGTSEDPIASMLLKLGWSITTVVKASQGTSIYHLQGDGKFREMGGPFSRGEAKRISRLLERSGLELSGDVPLIP